LVLLGAGFVVCLILAILFYTQIEEAEVALTQAEQTQSLWANPEADLQALRSFGANNSLEGEGETVQQVNAALSELGQQSGNQTTVRRLMSVNQQLLNLARDARTDAQEAQRQVQAMQAQLQQANAATAEVQREVDTFEDVRAQVVAEHVSQRESLQQQIGRLEQQLAQAQQQIDATMEAVRGNSQEALAQLQQQLQAQQQTLAERSEQIASLEADNLSLTTQLQNTTQQQVASQTQPDGSITALLSEGRVVRIDRGRDDQLRAGMTFEVFGQDELIEVDEQGQTRGKATVEVVTLEDRSARARVVRTSPNTRVQTGDRIVNVVYDPNATLSFYVHGNFDLQQSGNPNEQDADRIRSMVRRWGAEVAAGDGNLSPSVDFLVLGVEPRVPTEPDPMTTDPTVWERYYAQRQQYESYQQLLRQAREMRIPVLNQNRFLTLYGFYER
jgi:hypothetical protein